jgi:hypothetical protein
VIAGEVSYGVINVSLRPPRRPGQWRDLHDHRRMAVTKTEEQLREEILGRLQKLGLFEDAGQLKAVG